MVRGLKSRAAFKLLQVYLLESSPFSKGGFGRLANMVISQIDEQYRIFRSGQTVVDLVSHPGDTMHQALIIVVLVLTAIYRDMHLVHGLR